MEFYDKIVKDAVEEITNAWGYGATLDAFAKSFADYANSFTEGSEERASTERMAKKVTELSRQLNEMI